MKRDVELRGDRVGRAEGARLEPWGTPRLKIIEHSVIISACTRSKAVRLIVDVKYRFAINAYPYFLTKRAFPELRLSIVLLLLNLKKNLKYVEWEIYEHAVLELFKAST